MSQISKCYNENCENNYMGAYCECCEITIDEYLAMRPMVLPVMKLSMSEAPEEQLPMEVTFTIDIGLSGGRHLVNDICINMK